MINLSIKLFLYNLGIVQNTNIIIIILSLLLMSVLFAKFFHLFNFCDSLL